MWFTAGDILAIGGMLPQLMTARQATTAARAGADVAALGAPEVVTTDTIERWASIGLTGPAASAQSRRGGTASARATAGSRGGRRSGTARRPGS